MWIFGDFELTSYIFYMFLEWAESADIVLRVDFLFWLLDLDLDFRLPLLLDFPTKGLLVSM